MLFGSFPSYDSLRVFGCVCFVLLQDHESNKLQSRSRLCCFLGYEIGQKGYRCYDPIRKRLRVSRHVVFWEFYQLPHVPVSPIPSIDPLLDLFPEESPTSMSEHPPLVSESPPLIFDVSSHASDELCDAPFSTRPAWADPNRVRDATKITQNHIFAEAIIKLGKPIII